MAEWSWDCLWLPLDAFGFESWVEHGTVELTEDTVSLEEVASRSHHLRFERRSSPQAS